MAPKLDFYAILISFLKSSTNLGPLIPLSDP